MNILYTGPHLNFKFHEAKLEESVRFNQLQKKILTAISDEFVNFKPSEQGYGLINEDDENWLVKDIIKKTLKKKITKVMPAYKQGLAQLSPIKAFSYFSDSWPFGSKKPSDIIILARTLTG